MCVCVGCVCVCACVCVCVCECERVHIFHIVLHLLFTRAEMNSYVTGSEKRGHFAQNANFYHFSNCHHTKAFRAHGFPLAL